MNSVLFLFPVIFTWCFLIPSGSAENTAGYDPKNPPWDELFAPFEPGKSKLTTPPPFYKRIFKSAWNLAWNLAREKVFKLKPEVTKDRYHCLKKKDYTLYVVAKYFHYTFTMRKTTKPQFRDLFTKIPFVGKLFQIKTTPKLNKL
uniref:Uncharacterized protein n=1 Tax=Cacopsylla melanoneura TaxID=428564 RepID=A0A8D9BSM5_9HEMI